MVLFWDPLLEPSWELLGLSWEGLGPLLGASWPLLGPPRHSLGPSWEQLWRPKPTSGAHCIFVLHKNRPRGLPGGSREPPGRVPGASREPCWDDFGPFKTSPSHLQQLPKTPHQPIFWQPVQGSKLRGRRQSAKPVNNDNNE